MKAAIVLSFVTAAMAAVINERTNGCNADNCARAVTGTRDGLLPITSRQADCSSFMRATVTPKATYVYLYNVYIHIGNSFMLTIVQQHHHHHHHC